VVVSHPHQQSIEGTTESKPQPVAGRRAEKKMKVWVVSNEWQKEADEGILSQPPSDQSRRLRFIIDDRKAFLSSCAPPYYCSLLLPFVDEELLQSDGAS